MARMVTAGIWGAFAIACGLLLSCAGQPHAGGTPGSAVQTLTLQYRIAADAVAPSRFVALYPEGMSMGLEVHWRIDNAEKRALDALLARIEKARDNGAEFTAKGRWLQEGAELEVYEISPKR